MQTFRNNFPKTQNPSSFRSLNIIDPKFIPLIQIKNKIRYAIAAIDERLNKQLNAILHHPSFQKLEASWRGLEYLLFHTKSFNTVIIKVLNVSWNEVFKDIKRASDIESSQLFDKIHNKEYDIAGGNPFNILLGDYFAFSQGITPADLATLRGLSQIAAAAFSVFIMSVDAKLFGVDNFSQLKSFKGLSKFFKQLEFTSWESFRKSEDSRFISLLLPRVRLRPCYQDVELHNTGFLFGEQTFSTQDVLWGNPCYGYGVVIARSFAHHNWFGDIRGLRDDRNSGGCCPNFFEINNQEPIKAQFLTEIYITEIQEVYLAEAGFTSLSYNQQAKQLVFYSAQTVQRYKIYESSLVTANSAASSMLQYILCASRFAHYLKKIGRSKLGLFWRAQECESFLERWLTRFVMTNDSDSDFLRAQYPLKGAKVRVKEVAGKPGHYQCIIHLQPSFQLEQLSASVVFFTELTA